VRVKTGHNVSFRPVCSGASTADAQMGPRSVEVKGPDALRWHLGKQHHTRIRARSRAHRVTFVASACALGGGVDQSNAPRCQGAVGAGRISLNAVDGWAAQSGGLGDVADLQEQDRRSEWNNNCGFTRDMEIDFSDEAGDGQRKVEAQFL
jgi:hypothetical protein